MKRISLLKKVLIVGGTVAIVTPVATMLSSCASSGIVTDVIAGASLSQMKIDDMTHANYSVNNLLYGSRSIYGGNYILIIGSNQDSSACKFFANDASIRNRNQWYSTDPSKGYLPESIFYNANRLAKEADPELKSYGLCNYIDFYNSHYYDKKGHILHLTKNKSKGEDDLFSPFEQWTKALIEQTKAYNSDPPLRPGSDEPAFEKYDWDSDSVKEGEFIRNDATAVALRNLYSRGALLYPDKDKTFPKIDDFKDGKQDYSRMIIFKNGVAQSIEALPTNAEDAAKNLSKKIVDNYSLNEKKDEKK